MVTGALWSDVNGDGWLDLLVTHEWGPVRLFINLKGAKLMEATSGTGLSELSGWWNGITGGDFDNDGDIDYAVTNFGLNTKYHASPEKPALLYYGDLDGSGKKHLIEAEFEGSVCYPVRGKSCSTHAIPSLAKKFPSYQAFALAELGDIYSPAQLAAAQKFEAQELQSGVLLNDGKGRFVFKPLPRLAQIAPGFGVVAGEFDGDGHTDLAIAQNFFSPQPETGRMDGGLSLLLTGAGDGSFRAHLPETSGITVAGDAAGLSTSDLNADGAADLHFAVNSEAVRGFAATPARKTLAVRLPASMPGARVTLGKQTAELYAGSGYLSQSAPVLFFASPQQPAQLSVRWPDGEVTRHKIARGAKAIAVKR